jgi:hypothetical protein
VSSNKSLTTRRAEPWTGFKSGSTESKRSEQLAGSRSTGDMMEHDKHLSLVSYCESFLERHGDCHLGVGWTREKECPSGYARGGRPGRLGGDRSRFGAATGVSGWESAWLPEPGPPVVGRPLAPGGSHPVESSFRGRGQQTGSAGEEDAAASAALAWRAACQRSGRRSPSCSAGVVGRRLSTS